MSTKHDANLGFLSTMAIVLATRAQMPCPSIAKLKVTLQLKTIPCPQTVLEAEAGISNWFRMLDAVQIDLLHWYC
jgi:hypothetical protein